MFDDVKEVESKNPNPPKETLLNQSKTVKDEDSTDSEDEDLFDPDPKPVKKSKPEINDEDDYDSMEDLYYLDDRDAITYSAGNYFLLLDGNKRFLIFGCENQALGYVKNHPETKVQNYNTIEEAMAAGDQYMKLKHELQNQKQVPSPKTVALQQEVNEIEQIAPPKKRGRPRKNSTVATSNKKNKAPAATKVTPVKKENSNSLNFSTCSTSQLNAGNLIQEFQPPEEEKEEIESNIRNLSNAGRSALQFMYFLLGEYILIVFQMLDSRNHDYWCIKSDTLSTAFATPNTSIQVIDAMKYFYEFTFRKERHGANMAKMTLNKTKNRHYEVRGLFTSIRRNPAMLVEIQIQQFANKVQGVLTHPNFPGYYIYMLRQTGADRIAEILKQKTAPFWKHLQEAEVRIVPGRHLDAVFLDEDIAKIIARVFPDNRNSNDWDWSFKKLMYLSGELPHSFPLTGE